MVFRNRLLAVFAGMILLASPQFGFAETTTIEVPQGTGVFPTIGQIDDDIKRKFHGNSNYTALGSILENELTRCLVSQYENHCRRLNVSARYTCDDGRETAGYLTSNLVNMVPMSALSYSGQLQNSGHFGAFNEESGFPCRDLAEEHLSTLGIEVHYCDECDNPNQYHLAASE